MSSSKTYKDVVKSLEGDPATMELRLKLLKLRYQKALRRLLIYAEAPPPATMPPIPPKDSAFVGIEVEVLRLLPAAHKTPEMVAWVEKRSELVRADLLEKLRKIKSTLKKSSMRFMRRYDD